MQRNDPERDEEEWRSIVEHYGDRVEIDDEPTPPEPPALPEPPAPEVAVAAPIPAPIFAPIPASVPEDPDRFVAPDPPLPPTPSRDRLAAWVGVLGSPVVLLVMVLAGLDIPSLLAYALVVGFIGGFLYLVLHLPRSPEDPWDDGARL